MIYNAFKSIGIIIDTKPRNVASLRGYSYDPEGYFNHKAQRLMQYHKPKPRPVKHTYYNYSGHSTQSDVEQLINEISKKRIDITSTYDHWLSIAFAFAKEFRESGRQYFHDVSSSYFAYDKRETDDQFNKCLCSRGSHKVITIKTFFHLCKAAGIELPKEIKLSSKQ